MPTPQYMSYLRTIGVDLSSLRLDQLNKIADALDDTWEDMPPSDRMIILSFIINKLSRTVQDQNKDTLVNLLIMAVRLA